MGLQSSSSVYDTQVCWVEIRPGNFDKFWQFTRI